MSQDEFIKMVEGLADKYSPMQVFQDACRMMALSIHSPLIFEGMEKDGVEREYAGFVEKYGKESPAAFGRLLGAVMVALEETRTDFLGGVMERMGATNKHTAQFLTPVCLSRLMGRMNFDGKDINPGEIVELSDPCCGAGAKRLYI